MKHSYNSREQKIYLDYYKVSDAELQKIVENKKSYRDEIIVVIEDILVERGLLTQITLDPIKYEHTLQKGFMNIMQQRKQC